MELDSYREEGVLGVVLSGARATAGPTHHSRGTTQSGAAPQFYVRATLDNGMEEIIERVRYPWAPLTKCPRPPIGDGEITALIRNLEYEPIFRGVWTLDDTGGPVAILHALDERNFRAAPANMAGVLAWNWNHHFGRLLSFALVVPGERSPRLFLPDDCACKRLAPDDTYPTGWRGGEQSACQRRTVWVSYSGSEYVIVSVEQMSAPERL